MGNKYEKKNKEYAAVIQEAINSPEFLEGARKEAKDFSRKRKLPFPKLCLFLLGIVHECLLVAFRRFSEKIDENIKITEQSLSEARNKIKWEAFAELFETIGKFAYTGDYDRWNSYRIWAIDGTKITLPNYPSLASHFGDEKGSPMARASILYDVINYTVFDASIEPLGVDERTMARSHLDRLVQRMQTDKELVISDRGYPSEEMIDDYESKNLFYLMRVRKRFNLDADNQQSDNGYIQIGGHKVRVIKVRLDTGEIETLLTNVTENFDFKELYFLRWGVEKEYDVLKNTLEIENFSGRTETAIKQDFYIHMIASNMLAASFWEAQEIVDEKRNISGENKYKYIVNTAQAASVLRDYLILAILASTSHKRTRILNKMHRIMASAVIPIRPNRTVPRKTNNRKAKFHHNSKPNL